MTIQVGYQQTLYIDDINDNIVFEDNTSSDGVVRDYFFLKIQIQRAGITYDTIYGTLPGDSGPANDYLYFLTTDGRTHKINFNNIKNINGSEPEDIQEALSLFQGIM